MRVYLDICCLKRPFDDQTQPRVHLESEAVLSLLDAPVEKVELIRAPAHSLENEQNPLPQRAARVRQWLEMGPTVDLDDAALTARTEALMALGFKNFDAFHLASAELAGADVFTTSDDRLLAAARRYSKKLTIRVVNPLDLLREIFP